jgi:SAM-dependent methyltransferase
VQCIDCGARYSIAEGIVDMLDPSNEELRREIAGWVEMAGGLGDHLIPTMTALPYYPHDPWLQLAPDFFQIFEHVSFMGKRVVDIGAGRTWSSRHLAAVGRASLVVAIDVLMEPYLGLATADVFFREDQIFFERLRADLHRIPLPDGWADIVFTCASLHHSSDLESMYREVRRVLRPGGHFIFLSEPCKKASIPDRHPHNAETAHGINENIYSLSEYIDPLRKLGFDVRRLVPRSIRYRLVNPDPAFEGGIPKLMRWLTKTERRRDILEILLRSRATGNLLYRYWSLPLTVIATKE